MVHTLAGSPEGGNPEGGVSKTNREKLASEIKSEYLKHGGDVSVFAEKNAERFKTSEAFIVKTLKKFAAPQRSKGEQSLMPILRKMFPGKKVLEQQPIGSYRMDFYIPALRLCIEYDGVQHFKQGFFHGKGYIGEHKFEAGVKADADKEKLCAQNGIYVIRIGYTEKLNIDNIRRILEEHWTQVIHNLSHFASETRDLE